MRRFSDLPIARKLTLFSMLTTTTALIVASICALVYEHFSARRTLAIELTSMAQLVGYNSSAALLFEDSASARQTLHGLLAQTHIVGACLYNAKNEVFAFVERRPGAIGQWPEPSGDGAARYVDRRLEVFRRVEAGGELAGFIYLRADLSPLDERVARWTWISIAVAIVALAAAWAISSRLQRVISGPVAELASVVDIVTHRKDYAVRARKRSDDEFGRLITGFNAMLEQIQSNEADLKASRTELELRVEERTVSLRRQQAEMQALFDLIPAGVMLRDARDVTLRANKRAGELLGRPLEQIEGRHIHEIFPENAERVLAEDMAVLDTAKPLMGITEQVGHANGKPFWMQIDKVPVCDADGRTMGLVVMIQDISERKRTEQELVETHERLLDLSRRAGMAEIATGVLHNVGNVLNSVNVAATVVIDQVRDSQSVNVGRVAVLLQQHADDLPGFFRPDARGAQVPGYLQMLDQELARERATIGAELEQLRRHLEHIKDIVAMQQSYAKVSGVSETVPICELVEDALQMNSAALTRHGLKVVREYQARPIVVVERHKILQILVNLIRNAKYACDEVGAGEKLLTIRVCTSAELVQIAVIDTGIGIPAENLTRIFNHGFTTRAEGHGFGLHSGALAAKEIGGSLRAHSDGPGRGATFVLEVPFQPKPKE